MSLTFITFIIISIRQNGKGLLPDLIRCLFQPDRQNKCWLSKYLQNHG